MTMLTPSREQYSLRQQNRQQHLLKLNSTSLHSLNLHSLNLHSLRLPGLKLPSLELRLKLHGFNRHSFNLHNAKSHGFKQHILKPHNLEHYVLPPGLRLALLHSSRTPNRYEKRCFNFCRNALAAARFLPFWVLFGVTFSVPTLARDNDSLHLVGALGYGHDDNLLRVPDGAPPFDNRYGDAWISAEGGVVFDQTYSRQRVSGQAKLSKVQFNHFRQLDYDGKDILVNWNWQLGNHLEGLLGGSYNQTLAPYTDFRSDERNLRKQSRLYFDGAWRFHPSWQARTASSRDKFTYDLTSQRVNDRTEDAFELGADYLPPSGSTVGVVLRKVKGNYPNRRQLGTQLVSDDYDQDEVKARVNWIASGSTNISALGGWVRRSQPSLGGTTSGFNGRISATHAPRGPIRYNAALWRDFAPIESIYVNYTLNKGASIGASYDVSAKLTLEAALSAERRAYNARVVQALGANLKDSIRSASLSAAYTPSRNLKLNASLVHQGRSGSPALGTGSFTSNSIVLTASAQF
jgi:exopolysaccharide biosynthesis operon protein EpsL